MFSAFDASGIRELERSVNGRAATGRLLEAIESMKNTRHEQKQKKSPRKARSVAAVMIEKQTGVLRSSWDELDQEDKGGGPSLTVSSSCFACRDGQRKDEGN